MAQYFFGISLLQKGLFFRVGNGESIRIWEDSWIPDVPLQRPLTKLNVVVHICYVAELIDKGELCWNLDLSLLRI